MASALYQCLAAMLPIDCKMCADIINDIIQCISIKQNDIHTSAKSIASTWNGRCVAATYTGIAGITGTGTCATAATVR